MYIIILIFVHHSSPSESVSVPHGHVTPDDVATRNQEVFAETVVKTMRSPRLLNKPVI